jgi:hypothetical protein
MPDPNQLTTEISVGADNETLVDFLENQYGKLEAGEARAALEDQYSTVWNEDELQAAFSVHEIVPPYVYVVHKESGQTGTLIYVDSPRFYFLFNPEIKNGE